MDNAVESRELRRRTWCGLHLSTWIALSSAASVLVVLIIPGEWNGVWFFRSPISLHYEHGWPWTFLRREAHNWPTTDPYWLDLDCWSFAGNTVRHGLSGEHQLGWWPAWLAVDVVVAGLILLSIGIAMERRQQYRRLWQVSMREWLIVTVIVACGIGSWSSFQHASDRERSRAVREFGAANCRLEYRGPAFLRRIFGASRSLNRVVNVDVSQLAEASTLKSYPYLERVRLDDARVRGTPPATALSQAIAELAEVPRLRRLTLVLTKSRDPQLKALAQLGELRHLEVNCGPEVGKLSGIGAVKTLETLTLDATLDSGDIHRLPQLRYLRSLHLITPIDSNELRDFTKVSSLRELSVFIDEVGRSDLTVLANMPRLTSLELSGDLDDGELTHVGKIGSLRYLNIRATNASAALVARLKQRLPQCSIYGPRQGFP